MIPWKCHPTIERPVAGTAPPALRPEVPGADGSDEQIEGGEGGREYDETALHPRVGLVGETML